ncbi:hypothetical protein N7454_005333 [Penicillium verhagenii]|nr:hypothetical protein N7454_005333 [Penicillium verhagenii]
MSHSSYLARTEPNRPLYDPTSHDPKYWRAQRPDTYSSLPLPVEQPAQHYVWCDRHTRASLPQPMARGLRGFTGGVPRASSRGRGFPGRGRSPHHRVGQPACTLPPLVPVVLVVVFVVVFVVFVDDLDRVKFRGVQPQGLSAI